MPAENLMLLEVYTVHHATRLLVEVQMSNGGEYLVEGSVSQWKEGRKEFYIHNHLWLKGASRAGKTYTKDATL